MLTIARFTLARFTFINQGDWISQIPQSNLNQSQDILHTLFSIHIVTTLKMSSSYDRYVQGYWNPRIYSLSPSPGLNWLALRFTPPLLLPLIRHTVKIPSAREQRNPCNFCIHKPIYIRHTSGWFGMLCLVSYYVFFSNQIIIIMIIKYYFLRDASWAVLIHTYL